MNLNYTLHDAEQWATFSGDYNPIHFDLQQVRKMGGEQLSVHGMRVMLDMKRYLSAILLAGVPKQDFYVFNARMRWPVLYQTPYHLLIADCGTLVTGKLLDRTTQESCFSSKLASASPLVLEDRVQEHSLMLAEVMDLAQQFPGVASDITQTWGFLDALLFQLLVKSPETLATLSLLLPELTASTLTDVFTQVPVVQTHHQTHFSALFFTSSPHFHIEERLQYVIQPTLIMGDKKSGFVLRAAIQANTQQQPLITTTVTLKTWPLVTN